MVWVGARSYGIYLWQSPLIYAATVHGANRFIGAAAAVVAAGVSWRVVEVPFLALKARLAASSPAPASTTARPPAITPSPEPDAGPAPVA
jgi:peptidoglycan/LPS O-acetylase OafA/YrhL